MNKQALKKEIAALRPEQLIEQLKKAMEAVDAAAAQLERESTVAQTEAAEAIVASYKKEGEELERLAAEQDAEDAADAAEEELERAGKMPE